VIVTFTFSFLQPREFGVNQHVAFFPFHFNRGMPRRRFSRFAEYTLQLVAEAAHQREWIRAEQIRPEQIRTQEGDYLVFRGFRPGDFDFCHGSYLLQPDRVHVHIQD
jgi:hypothetical protein